MFLRRFYGSWKMTGTLIWISEGDINVCLCFSAYSVKVDLRIKWSTESLLVTAGGCCSSGSTAFYLGLRWSRKLYSLFTSASSATVSDRFKSSLFARGRSTSWSTCLISEWFFVLLGTERSTDLMFVDTTNSYFWAYVLTRGFNTGDLGSLFSLRGVFASSEEESPRSGSLTFFFLNSLLTKDSN